MSEQDAIRARVDGARAAVVPALIIPTEELARLLAAVDAIEALAEKWRYKGEFGWGAWQEGHGPDQEGYVLDQVAGELRTALSEALGGTG